MLIHRGGWVNFRCVLTLFCFTFLPSTYFAYCSYDKMTESCSKRWDPLEPYMRLSSLGELTEACSGWPECLSLSWNTLLSTVKWSRVCGQRFGCYWALLPYVLLNLSSKILHSRGSAYEAELYKTELLFQMTAGQHCLAKVGGRCRMVPRVMTLSMLVLCARDVGH